MTVMQSRTKGCEFAISLLRLRRVNGDDQGFRVGDPDDVSHLQVLDPAGIVDSEGDRVAASVVTVMEGTFGSIALTVTSASIWRDTVAPGFSPGLVASTGSPVFADGAPGALMAHGAFHVSSCDDVAGFQ